MAVQRKKDLNLPGPASPARLLTVLTGASRAAPRRRGRVPPCLYPSGTRDRRSWAIPQPEGYPKTPRNPQKRPLSRVWKNAGFVTRATPCWFGPAPLSRTVGSWGRCCLMRFASPWRRGAAGSDPRSDGGSPGVRTRVGKRSAAGRHASRRREITDPWLAGMLARSPSRRCGNVVRTIRRIIAAEA